MQPTGFNLALPCSTAPSFPSGFLQNGVQETLFMTNERIKGLVLQKNLLSKRLELVDEAPASLLYENETLLLKQLFPHVADLRTLSRGQLTSSFKEVTEELGELRSYKQRLVEQDLSDSSVDPIMPETETLERIVRKKHSSENSQLSCFLKTSPSLGRGRLDILAKQSAAARFQHTGEMKRVFLAFFAQVQSVLSQNEGDCKESCFDIEQQMSVIKDPEKLTVFFDEQIFTLSEKLAQRAFLSSSNMEELLQETRPSPTRRDYFSGLFKSVLYIGNFLLAKTAREASERPFSELARAFLMLFSLQETGHCLPRILDLLGESFSQEMLSQFMKECRSELRHYDEALAKEFVDCCLQYSTTLGLFVLLTDWTGLLDLNFRLNSFYEYKDTLLEKIPENQIMTLDAALHSLIRLCLVKRKVEDSVFVMEMRLLFLGKNKKPFPSFFDEPFWKELREDTKRDFVLSCLKRSTVLSLFLLSSDLSESIPLALRLLFLERYAEVIQTSLSQRDLQNMKRRLIDLAFACLLEQKTSQAYQIMLLLVQLIKKIDTPTTLFGSGSYLVSKVFLDLGKQLETLGDIPRMKALLDQVNEIARVDGIDSRDLRCVGLTSCMEMCLHSKDLLQAMSFAQELAPYHPLVVSVTEKRFVIACIEKILPRNGVVDELFLQEVVLWVNNFSNSMAAKKYARALVDCVYERRELTDDPNLLNLYNLFVQQLLLKPL